MSDFLSNPKPNLEAFMEVCLDLEKGNPLTFRHIGAIFGYPFWEIVLLSLMDRNSVINVFTSLGFKKENNV